MSGADDQLAVRNGQVDGPAAGQKGALIPEEIVVKAVRLLGNVAAMRGNLPAKKRRLMDGLCAMLDADGWLWTATRVLPDQDTPMSVGVIHDGLTEDEFSGWLEASQLAHDCPPEDPPLMKLFLEGQHYTRTRQNLVPDDVWYSHPTVKKYRLDRGLDSFLYSVFPLSELTCSAIGFFRRVGRPLFSEVERKICHIVVGNVAWMHLATFPEHQGEGVPDLTPRQRTVLIQLLDGKQRAEIARALRIKQPTVSEHINRIYRHFNVSSQVELMRYFQAGDCEPDDLLD